jgi:hypothetical protein
MSEPFILDADPIIPTGVPATPEQVAAMVVDPASVVTEDVIPLLVGEQQPTPEMIQAAIDGPVVELVEEPADA